MNRLLLIVQCCLALNGMLSTGSSTANNESEARDPASSSSRHRLTLLDAQLTDKLEVRLLLRLSCIIARKIEQCQTPPLLLNVTRSVGLYSWADSNQSAVQREAESALCQFFGDVIGDDGGVGKRFSFASLNLCRGPLGLIDTGRRKFLVEPWPRDSPGLNLTAEHFTASSQFNKRALEAAFITDANFVLLSTVASKPGLATAMSHQHSLAKFGPGRDPFAGKRCVTKTPPADPRPDNQRLSRRPRRSVSTTIVDEIVSHRFVEILFVVDSSIVSFHRAILDDFVFGILGIAQGVFRDPQLEESIELSLASVYRLTSEEEAEIMSLDTDQVASDVLDSFNAWIGRLHRSRFGQSVSWDISVLLTRKFLFSFVEFDGKLVKDPVLGITTYRSLCEMLRNGIVLQEIGLQSGFSLAHELGHTFNMYHDGSPVCSRKLYPHEARGNFVMDSSLHPSTYPWTWSTCSKLHLRQFLRTSQSDCTRERSRPAALQQQKSKRSFESRFYPRFTVNEQCRLLFGAEASQCDTNLRPCGTLWCRVSMSHNKSICWSKKVVWAPGTPCGNEKICLDGECVPAGHGAIDGGWSQWSEWTNCTVDCGGGVRWRRRFCDNPRPRRGGSFCRGQRAMAETCSQASCSQQSTGGSAEAPRVLVLGAGVTARDAQCAQFAVKQARSVEIAAEVGDAREQRLTAVALHHRLSSDSLCRSVTCSMQPADRSGNSVRSSRLARIFTVDRVRDGSPCHPFDYGVCIGGVCQPAGCDGVLNSNSRWDACGVCGGSNETCHLQSRSFEIDIKPGTSYLHTFSQGSSSIELMTEGGGGRFCTVELIKSSKDSSDKGKSVDSLYPNGNYMKTNLAETVNQKKPESNNFIEITSSKELADRFDEEYMASGAWILISKKQNDWRIRGIGRLSSNLSVRIKITSEIISTSNLHKKIKVTSRAFVPNLRIRVAAVDNCSRLCQGRQKVEHICEDISGMKLSAVRRLPMAVCRSVHPPIPIPPLPPSLMCNTHCRLEWRRVAGNCSARCGNGTAVDSFDCVLSKSDGTPDVVLDEPIKDVKYKDAYCDNRSVRLLQRDCIGDCRPVAWRLRSWSACSKTCGSGGTRSRLAVCEELQVFGGRRWPDSECKDEPIPGKLIEACENTTVECPKWKISEWSSCDAYCSSGIKQRSVYCRWKSEPVPSELCPGQMPETVRNCTGWCFGRWVAGTWSKCHMPCQNGHRFREVNCMIGTRKVNSLNCPRASMPEYLQDCSNQCVHWLYSKWGRCSTTCGSLGSQARLYLCANASNHLINSSYCMKWIGPPTDTVRPCFVDLPALPDCPDSRPPARRFDWRVTEWSKCSQSCGPHGMRHRRVDCLILDGSNETANETECSRLTPKPKSAEPCNTQINCPYWVIRPWSECLAECDEGIQLRSVRCHQNGSVVDERRCDQSARPIELRPCNSPTPCPGKWVAGQWSECSRSCGRHQGVRLRRVTCQSLSGRPAPDAACSHEQRPANLMECTQLPCPTWVPTEWSSCSVSASAVPVFELAICTVDGATVH
ncbi:hypothetical protein BOX15_Mlig024946g1 [Macrostomum lignano]|uniref:Peptidase M12B domain-containing protein n=1 Tax=Macrostomum lignano TaxID=282301 RepID=A0A267H5Y0_9PLAT|nr:hypothetical protein BOX15_Mlig024946g1 [Macrostomum lignano]